MYKSPIVKEPNHGKHNILEFNAISFLLKCFEIRTHIPMNMNIIKLSEH